MNIIFDSQTFTHYLDQDKSNRQTVKTSPLILITGLLSERFSRIIHASCCEKLITRNVWTLLINYSDSKHSKRWDKLAGISFAYANSLPPNLRLFTTKYFEIIGIWLQKRRKALIFPASAKRNLRWLIKLSAPVGPRIIENNWNKISLFARQDQPAAWRRRSVVDLNWVCEQKFDCDSIL